MKTGEDLCPCQSGDEYITCCGLLLENGLIAKTAEQLMRSRYTAYTLGKSDYLLQTWHPSQRPQSLSIETAVKWLGLQVLATLAGGEVDNAGQVEFIARYKYQGKAIRLQENSRFIRESDRWYYLDAANNLGLPPKS